jgi:hypothetical protein
VSSSAALSRPSFRYKQLQYTRQWSKRVKKKCTNEPSRPDSMFQCYRAYLIKMYPCSSILVTTLSRLSLRYQKPYSFYNEKQQNNCAHRISIFQFVSTKTDNSGCLISIWMNREYLHANLHANIYHANIYHYWSSLFWFETTSCFGDRSPSITTSLVYFDSKLLVVSGMVDCCVAASSTISEYSGKQILTGCF